MRIPPVMVQVQVVTVAELVMEAQVIDFTYSFIMCNEKFCTLLEKLSSLLLSCPD